MSRVAVVGAGAIGSSFAAELLRTGRHDLLLFGRTPRSQLVMNTPDGTTTFDVPTLTEIDGQTGCDWVFVAVKATECEAAAELVTALSRPRTRIVVLQNGVEARARMAPHVSGNPVVECVVKCAAERLPDGSVRRRGPAQLILTDDGSGRDIRQMFEGSAAEITLTDDLTSALWRKLCINASGGSITALTSQPMRVLHEPQVSRVAAALIAECAAVGRKCGAVVEVGDERAILAELLAQPATATTSMLRSRLAGEPIEHDAISGAVLRAAERHGVSVPITGAIDALLSALANGPGLVS